MSGARPIEEYWRWLRAQALPRWASDGFDTVHGRFRERLDRKAGPIDVPHRAMVQARQIFVFADAARRNWLPAGAALAETAMASLLRDFASEGASEVSFAFSIGSDGRPVSSTRDAYAHAFALFSLAALYRLNGEPRLLLIADKTIRFIETHLTDPQHGGLFDALPDPASGKRQNPHMHLLEAYLFLEQAAPGRGYLERAAEIVALFEQRFFDAETQVLLEYFDADWSRHPDDERATLWEPGHHFEWAWLLDRFARAIGEPTRPSSRILHDQAARHGITSDGLVIDSLDSIEKRVLHGSARVWPHTEAIKAAVTRHHAGDLEARGLADTMAATLLARFLDRPFSGGWIDHISELDEPLVDYVPASSLYHLFLAGTEASEAFDESSAPNVVSQVA